MRKLQCCACGVGLKRDDVVAVTRHGDLVHRSCHTSGSGFHHAQRRRRAAASGLDGFGGGGAPAPVPATDSKPKLRPHSYKSGKCIDRLFHHANLWADPSMFQKLKVRRNIVSNKRLNRRSSRRIN